MKFDNIDKIIMDFYSIMGHVFDRNDISKYLCFYCHSNEIDINVGMSVRAKK